MKKWLKIMFVSSALMLACISAGRVGSHVVVRAEEETSEEVISEETTEEVAVSEEESEEKSWVKQSYETYIVPLFAGVSATSVLSAVICILATIIKNHKLDKKLVEIEEKNAIVTQKIEEINEILMVIHHIKDDVGYQNNINEQIKGFVVEKMSEVEEKVKDVVENTAHVEQLEKLIKLLAQLEVKVAKQSKEVIKSGIIDDINEIVGLVETL